MPHANTQPGLGAGCKVYLKTRIDARNIPRQGPRHRNGGASAGGHRRKTGAAGTLTQKAGTPKFRHVRFLRLAKPVSRFAHATA